MTPIAKVLRPELDKPHPLTALREAVIRRLVIDDISREAVLADLGDLREAVHREGREDLEEMVLVVMDHLVGFCNPQWSLRNVGWSETDVPVAAQLVA